MRIEFADEAVLAFCEQRPGCMFPWAPTLRHHLMTRIQSLDAALDERDVLALRSLDYRANEAARGSIRVGDAHRLSIEFLPGPPAAVSIKGLELAHYTGDRNV
ncbi:hypothetical protein SAMN06295909_0095 [Plantibacter sp. VKM Ac-1784]|uniref:Uncharacterized protein n=1 Tax=Plantibacter elymi (nom. nud.) TaxID=199708 RepID=A0ABY1R986_9MICO|nr:hypothetical protein [Plantibacter sp. VKM Ac-1784]SMQ58045.1 hypothetical protein SAMN06295909_0095 [Plantibacter sp. VKM Ac-1784]